MHIWAVGLILWIVGGALCAGVTWRLKHKDTASLKQVANQLADAKKRSKVISDSWDQEK